MASPWMSNLYEVNYNPDFNVQFMTNFFFSPLNHTYIFGLLHWASTLNSTTLCLPHFNIVINWNTRAVKDAQIKTEDASTRISMHQNMINPPSK